ncbi:MAG: type II toxin-antitoxin system VapC family toxin [Planctomycetota bacterium]|nr:type II toxin-antitoxin system VapC family toxin [Planctomycetota bacterium]MDA1139271.1 type II toxin-antitoxin system VapC family toxin [Planctomycetota bacterium]
MRVAIDTDFLVRLSIADHPGRDAAVELREHHVDAGDRFALAPQVVSEFIHVVTDPRRFTDPLSIPEALKVARQWCEAEEVFLLFTDTDSLSRFFDLMEQFGLGRKRVLDTSLAATCLAAGVTHLITGNAADYAIFPGLQLIEMS